MTERKRRLEKQAIKKVSDIDLFLATHKEKIRLGSTTNQLRGKWSNAWKEMEIAQDTNSSGSKSINLTRDQLWARDNATKKGSIYGLGAEGGKYKNSTHGYSASSSYTEEQLDKKKLVEEIEALKQENREQNEERKQMSEQLQAVMETLNEVKEKKKKKKKKRTSYSTE